MSEVVDLVMKGISIARGFSSQSQSGLTYTSDQITYPNDLERVPDQVLSFNATALWINGHGASMHAGTSIVFVVKGDRREFWQIIDDPNSITPPVMANVYVALDSNEKSDATTAEVHFSALETPYGTPEAPRIRFVCEGTFDPAGPGDCRFRAVLEIDPAGGVTCVDGTPQLTGGKADLDDRSPNGFVVSIESPQFDL